MCNIPYSFISYRPRQAQLGMFGVEKFGRHDSWNNITREANTIAIIFSPFSEKVIISNATNKEKTTLRLNYQY